MKCRNCNQEDCPNAVEFELEWAQDIIKSALQVLENHANQAPTEAERIKWRSVYMGVALGEVRHKAVNPALKHHTVEIVASTQIAKRYQSSGPQLPPELVQRMREALEDRMENHVINETLKGEKPN